ncbi:dihydroorotase [Catalinimonas alkaloidigena]|uniref:Dihydroorotase n=1 Tax=Catalinimonas alkaloidigena TaxID=1075417 RepID=A0A1G9USG9_9BACT|nr:dihydroorotase [Catalinimonas alkaloidigena]SDM62833.1 dihydroorotase [Catalinimonas alkaloidigena]
MSLLITDVTLLAPGAALHHQVVNVLIEEGKIRSIGSERPSAAQVVDGTGCMLSPGWVDLRCLVSEPGGEHRESVESACLAAAAGGFTAVVTLPNTQPVVQTKDLLTSLRSRSEAYPAQLWPMGALSVNTEGEIITEMIDLHRHGAVAFTDGLRPVQSADLMVKALLYLKQFGGLLVNRAENQALTRYGVMHEGIQSTMLGMKGIPPLAEYTQVARDLSLLEYTGGRLHFSTLSSAQSVALIREAKQRGLQVTCDVAAHQLAFDDTALQDFDTNYKVNPPFRTQDDVQALREGLADGTIDAIVSDHLPLDPEAKQLEFDLADFGITGLETAYAVAQQHSGLSAEQLVEKLALAPRRILQMPAVEIAPGQPANLTLFDPKRTWTYEARHAFSQSLNSPFLGKTLRGKPLAVVRGTHFYHDAQHLDVKSA